MEEETIIQFNNDKKSSDFIHDLTRHINSIELPQEYDLEGKKRLALQNDPSVKRFVELLPLILSLIDELNDKPIDQHDKSPMPISTETQIVEVSNGELVDDGYLIRLKGSYAFVTALQRLICRPITYLDLTIHFSDLRLLGNRFLNTLLKLKPNLFSAIYKRICQKKLTFIDNTCDSHHNGLIDNNSTNDNYRIESLCNETIISLATCSYIHRCEREVSLEIVQCFPQVITHESLLLCHIPCIVSLLEKTEVIVHEKGLLLLESLIKNIEPHTLDQTFLDTFETSSLHKQLFRIMIFSPLCTNRKKAYDLFIILCDLLTYDCKFKIFNSVLAQTDLSPCIRAACIDQYRKHLTIVFRELTNLHLQQLTASAEKQTSTVNEFLRNSVSINSTKAISGSNETESNEKLCTTSQDKEIFEGDSNRPEKFIITKNSAINIPIMERMKCLQNRYKALGGALLIEFLNLCLKACLPDLQHTDIIENYELLLATLTMFRFLKLRHTIFKDDIEDEYLTGKKLKKIFFEPVRSAISLIVAELKQQQKHQDEADCLNWALCRLDLVESILVRTCDIYNC